MAPRYHPDRHTARRPYRHFLWLAALLVLLAASIQAVEWDLSALLEAQSRGQAMERMSRWLGAFLEPDLSGETLRLGWTLALQTLSAALMGTALAVLLGYGLALGSSRAILVGAESRAGLVSRLEGLALRALCSGCRLLQDVLRAVPCFVWAVVLVSVVGLGPLTGALALALNMTGLLAKVYSELWDSVNPAAYAQVRAMGGSRLATFLYGIRPLAARGVQSFTLMRAECAIRNASVIGVVGGGGLGADIWYQIGLGQWSKASTLILFTLALTLSADLGSTFIRRQLRSDPNHPSCSSRTSAVFRLARPYVGTLFVLAAVTWAVWFMGWGENAPPGQEAKNFLEPALQLARGESWSNLAFFRKLLEPELDLTLSGPGNREWFVWRVIRSGAVPLALAVVSTLLGALLAMLLAYPHSIAFQLESASFTGERSHPLIRITRLVQLALARLTALVARGVPDVLWCFLFMAFFGPGLLAGAAALTLHTTGVLVRVFSESVDNIPYRRFEQGCMGSRMACFVQVAGPLSWKEWLTYTFFQFESNVRAGVILGIVGVGGLGFLFSVNFEFFQFERASTCLIVIILLTVIIDRFSRVLHLSRVKA